MLYNQTIQIRLSQDQYQRYLAGAHQAGLSLSHYLRYQLDQQAVWQDELWRQRQLLEDLTALMATLPAVAGGETSSPPSSPESSDSPALISIWTELLLLSRLQAGPDKVLRVARDLERWGLPVWSPPVAPT